MLLPDEQLTLAHAGLTPQGRATLGNVLAGRSTILAQVAGDGSTAGGLVSGGNTTHDGLVYANTTIPAGDTIANTAAATTFASTYAFAANTFQTGCVIGVKGWGVYSTDVAAPNLTLQISLGTIILTTGAQLMTASMTNKGWYVDAQIHVTATGAAGAAEAQGYVEYATATLQSANMANTLAVVLNTTISRTLGIRMTWSAANANNTITLRALAIRLEQAQTFS